MVPVVVVDRPGWRLKALASKAARTFADSQVPEADARGLALRPPPAWTFLTGPLSHLSSTALRNLTKPQRDPVAKKVQPSAAPPRRRSAASARGRLAHALSAAAPDDPPQGP